MEYRNQLIYPSENVAGEGLQFTVHKESVVEKEVKEVELRSCLAQFIYDRSYNPIGLQPSGHAPNRLAVKKLRRLLYERGKQGYLYRRLSGKMSSLTIPPHSQLIPSTTPKCTLP